MDIGGLVESFREDDRGKVIRIKIGSVRNGEVVVLRVILEGVIDGFVRWEIIKGS